MEARTPDTAYTDCRLSTVLRLNNPSQAEDKLRNDSIDSVDPVINHLMGSRAVKCVIWSLVVIVLLMGVAAVVVLALWEYADGLARASVMSIGIPILLGFVPAATAVAMLCSRRLR
jgi:hypothetical protein